MSGECEKCGEHTLDCFCKYPICSICERPLYRFDKICVNCLKYEAIELIKDSDELMKKIIDK